MAKIKSALNKGRKKKPRIKNIEAADILKTYGPNPIYDGQGLEDPHYTCELSMALSWCGRSLDQKELRKELLTWMNMSGYSKSDVTAVKATKDCFGILDGKMCYLIHNNWPLAEDMEQRLITRISRLIADGSIIAKENKRAAAKRKKTDTLKQDTKESPESINFRDAQEIADEIEDDIILKLKINDVRINAIIKGKKAVVLNKSIEMLRELLEEIDLIGKEAQVTESYSFLKIETKAKKATKTHKAIKASKVDNVPKVIKMFLAAIALIEGEAINKKTIRRPKTIKAKSAAVQVKSVKYKANDAEYNLVSVEPINIIGKNKLIIFNTKTRKLGIYYAKDSDGFTFKGTTVQNFDDNISEQKTLRNTKAKKIGDWLLEFRKAPIKKVDKLFASINTTNVKLTGRTNNDTIILKVYK